MSTYIVSATVTSPPLDVSLQVNNTNINMLRDGSGNWAGTSQLDLPDTIPIAFHAVGFAAAPWTLEIKFNTLPPDNKTVLDYKHEDKIPNSLLSSLNDTAGLKVMVAK
jgi:hypothetical protein